MFDANRQEKAEWGKSRAYIPFTSLDMTLDVTHLRNSNIQMCLSFRRTRVWVPFQSHRTEMDVKQKTEQNWLSRDTRDDSTRAPQWHMAYRQTTNKRADRMSRASQNSGTKLQFNVGNIQTNALQREKRKQHWCCTHFNAVFHKIQMAHTKFHIEKFLYLASSVRWKFKRIIKLFPHRIYAARKSTESKLPGDSSISSRTLHTDSITATRASWAQNWENLKMSDWSDLVGFCVLVKRRRARANQ